MEIGKTDKLKLKETLGRGFYLKKWDSVFGLYFSIQVYRLKFLFGFLPYFKLAAHIDNKAALVYDHSIGERVAATLPNHIVHLDV